MRYFTNKKLFKVIALSTSLFILIACSESSELAKPNVILIMADDMGYECIGSYGSVYKTPVLDRLASNGILFTQCISQPLCTPSRVKIMTGLYNYRNYDDFGHLNTKERTFGNVMKDAGYATCIAGKWQLNGGAYPDKYDYWNDNTRPIKFGFDEYCLWQLTQGRKKGERYSDPLIEQNGELLKPGNDSYGPDIFKNYILDFITRKKDQPFFVYYPMVLVHEPFVPTPDSEGWKDEQNRYKKDTAYFKDMVTYTDKIVGEISDKLKELGIEDNTVLIFTGDNGTHTTVYTNTVEGVVRGAKGNTIETGTHVPLIASWPAKMKKGTVYEELIEFSDFFPTLADMVGLEEKSDGISIYPLLKGEEFTGRETAFVHYDPMWGERVNQYRNQFAQTVNYKLYQDGKYYRLTDDNLEKNALQESDITEDEQAIKKLLQDELDKAPVWE